MIYTERIRGLREDHDLTQKSIADILYVNRQTYADYEKGNVRIPIDRQIALAKYYNVSMDYISGVSDIKNDSPKPDGSEADCGISKNQAAAAGTRPGAGADGGNAPYEPARICSVRVRRAAAGRGHADRARALLRREHRLPCEHNRPAGPLPETLSLCSRSAVRREVRNPPPGLTGPPAPYTATPLDAGGKRTPLRTALPQLNRTSQN